MRSSILGEHVHTDVLGPFPVKLHTVHTIYLMSFIDVATRKSWVYGLPDKSAATSVGVLRRFCADIKKGQAQNILTSAIGSCVKKLMSSATCCMSTLACTLQICSRKHYHAVRFRPLVKTEPWTSPRILVIAGQDVGTGRYGMVQTIPAGRTCFSVSRRRCEVRKASLIVRVDARDGGLSH